MSQIEQIQVTLGLVDKDFTKTIDETGEVITGTDILKQLSTNHQWKHDHEGKYASVQFNGNEFQFRPGEIMRVGETVAKHLLRGSSICIGPDSLNGPMLPFLKVIEKRALSHAEKAGVTPTTCGICGVDQKTFPRLQRHIGEEKKAHPELFKEDKRDWDEKEEAKA